MNVGELIRELTKYSDKLPVYLHVVECKNNEDDPEDYDQAEDEAASVETAEFADGRTVVWISGETDFPEESDDAEAEV